jgi:hypothetical protein
MGITKRANFGYRVQGRLKVEKGDQVVLSTTDISNGFTTGFNQSTGAQGIVPMALFEPPSVVVDFGTNVIRAGYFNDDFKPILNDQGQSKRSSRCAFSNGWEFKAISSNQSIKGLKHWVRNENLEDLYFQLSGVRPSYDKIMNFYNGDSSVSIDTLLGLFFMTIKGDADREYQTSAESIVMIVPHRWTYYQKSLVRRAARLAGFYRVLIRSPSLCLTYSMQSAGRLGDRALLITMGACWTEIALVISGRITDIVGKELGGNAFTRAMYSHIVRHNRLSLSEPEARQLFKECEVAKLALSGAEYVDIPVPEGQLYRIDRSMLGSIFNVLVG